MAEKHADAMIFSDEKGNYYVVPREHFSLSKVDQTAKPEVEKLLDSSVQKPINLGEGLSFVGFMTLPEEARWTHYSPDIAWPHLYRPGNNPGSSSSS